ncbi:hypothetical protein KDJ56_11545 [Brevibacillus composti]|uniref:Uncharacterized protein n=1 Tax=Brevibacillus composti TaxID=2796470 RepID=A0A7T5EQ65_9BACL|nr:hypothetical protein [Brevibacillus composti]QQE76743.1 hypothetical protein JD108_11600 [Brevibacillus composti]QUO43811.1 hypothetical protein KDJ56_11545 [Brevibacillus composti]
MIIRPYGPRCLVDEIFQLFFCLGIQSGDPLFKERFGKSVQLQVELILRFDDLDNLR